MSLPFLNQPPQQLLPGEEIEIHVHEERHLNLNQNQVLNQPRGVSIGLNLKTSPNMLQRSFLDHSIKSNNCSLNQPYLSNNSEKNHLNFYEMYCRQNKLNISNKCPILNSNYEYGNIKSEICEEKPNRKNQEEVSKNHSRQPENFSMFRARPEDNSGAYLSFVEKPNPFCYFSKEPQNLVQNSIHLGENPFLCKPSGEHKSVEPAERKYLKKRPFQDLSFQKQSDNIKIKRRSLIVPKRDQFRLLNICQSETKSQMREESHAKMNTLYNSKWLRPQLTPSGVHFGEFKLVGSTIPDLSDEVRQAVEVMRKINSLNKTVKCNQKFRNKLTLLMESYDKKIADKD